ncbi:type VI secretion system protein TssA [Aquabacterium sp.]|uniref:type VI secretion system protein TssA n=1 Tax=Aquabacterium sp. TaxID=1872578 RepID=UPI0025B80893|nr:type VI secretion system protein TssA [Aquabacterium sp.]
MDFDALMAPIEGPSPAGEDLSFSTEFDQIAEMRREDDPTLDQGEWVTTLKVADWAGVTRLSTELLARRSKDLRLVMWLTEARTLSEGYEGLAGGLRLCTGLCERYWDVLYPLPDGGDMEERIGNLGWLLQRVVALAPQCPVTQGRQGGRHSLRDLAAARQRQSLSERQADAYQSHSARDGEAQPLSLEQFQRALQQTPHNVLRERLDALRDSLTQIVALQTVIDARLGDDGPSFVAAKEALQTALHDMERLAREAGLAEAGEASPAEGEHTAAADDGPGEPSPGKATGAGPRGPLATRTQALQQLREVAAFFRRTEPHSPVAYLAEKAVSWGEMPLHEWLRQVVKDQGAMSHLEELLGLRGPEHEGQ